MVDPGRTELYVALAALVSAGLLAIGLLRGRKREQKGLARDGDRSPPRPMPFMSALISMGAWPEDIKMADPNIVAFMYLDGTPDPSGMEAACSKILRFDNFRSVARRCPRRWLWPSPTRCEWHEIEVNPADLVTRTQAKGSGEVLREMERIRDMPLPRVNKDGRELPLWNIHVIENTELGNERGGLGTVVALRVDHSIADGLSLIVVARSVLKPAGPDGGDAEDAEDGGAKPGFGGTGVAEAVASGCRSQMKTVSSFGFSRVLTALSEVVSIATAAPDNPLPFGHPEAPMSRGFDGEPWQVPSPADLQQKWQRKPFSARRRTLLFPDVALSLVKRIKEVKGATVNDVMICLISGCIRRYCEANGDAKSLGGEGFQSKASVPVALPRSMSGEETDTVLCNRWVLVPMTLHVDEADPATRLEKIKQSTLALKRSPVPRILFLLQSHVLPHAPISVCREMIHNSLAMHTLAVSNVPGPQEPMNFARCRLRRIHSCFNNTSVHVGMISVDGKIGVTVTLDPLAMPDSMSLPRYYLEELKDLMSCLEVDGAAEVEEAEAHRAQLVSIMENIPPTLA